MSSLIWTKETSRTRSVEKPFINKYESRSQERYVLMFLKRKGECYFKSRHTSFFPVWFSVPRGITRTNLHGAAPVPRASASRLSTSSKVKPSPPTLSLWLGKTMPQNWATVWIVWPLVMVGESGVPLGYRKKNFFSGFGLEDRMFIHTHDIGCQKKTISTKVMKQ